MTDRVDFHADTLQGSVSKAVDIASDEIDWSAGKAHKADVSGSVTLTVTNLPPVGRIEEKFLLLNVDGSASMTYPSSFDWGDTGEPTLTDGVNIIRLLCVNGAKVHAVWVGGGFTYSSAWKTISGATYSSNDLDHSTEGSSGWKLVYNGDGTKLFVVCGGQVHRYSLSSGSINGATLDHSHTFAEDSDPRGIAINSDGTKMLMVGWVSGKVFEYDLGTGDDLTSISYSGNEWLHGVSNCISLEVSGDGLTLLLVSNLDGTVRPFTLGSGWSLSTTPSAGTTFDASGQDGSLRDVFLHPDGVQIFVVGGTNDEVYEYSLATVNEPSSANHDATYTPSSETTSVTCAAINPDGTKMLINNFSGPPADTIHEYTL